MEEQKNQRIFRMQPILCPWITSQPYHSSLWNKNRSAINQNDPSFSNRFLNNPWINRQMPLGIPRSHDKPLPTIQQSSSQFFYFLRLMQLFPDTHPATLHTVLALCKNDFFCAVDKMLYAKRCKLLCYKKNILQKNQQNRAKNEGKINTKNDPRRSASKVNVTGDRNTTESVNNLQEHTDTIIINSLPEKAEDLSTVKNVTG